LNLATTASVEVEFASMPPGTETNFVSEVCLPFFRAAQNNDGGWGFHAGSQSRVEPTAWVILALVEAGLSEELQKAGISYLRSTQLQDGSWPSSPGQTVGCWVTSLACWALSERSEFQQAVAAGLRWICEDWPRDLSLIDRAIRIIFSRKGIVSQNESLHGWGWTPNTASWVEPTAFALIALDQVPTRLLPQGAARRRKLGKALLYDRMCPGGGWNCGNPMVYGVPGDPLVEPTVWALLALRDEPNRQEITMSLEWLEKNLSQIKSARSLALSKICWEVYGRNWPPHVPTLRELYGKNEFFGSISAMAWAGLALSPRQHWLRIATPEKER
jgi:Squalene-hopene cyclase C-terminal domain